MNKARIALVIIIIVIASSFYVSQNFETRTEIISISNETVKEKIPTPSTQIGNIVKLKVPAIDNEGKGVVTTLRVETIPGAQGVLVDINNILFFLDTQFSIRTAEKVAENITGKDLSNVRLIYSIDTNASVVEGESAGAALTIATIAALTNRQVNPDVVITGTINADGTIGPIGSVLEKAEVSRDAGAKLFLVPSGQGLKTVYEPKRSCEKIGSFDYCVTRYEAKKIDISGELGIEIKEVTDVNEALKYFLQ